MRHNLTHGVVRVTDAREHARRFVREPVRLSHLALAFDESLATSAEVLVEGRGFYPPMLRDTGR